MLLYKTQDAITASLHDLSQQQPATARQRDSLRQKSSSFTELSDWNNGHRYMSYNLSLPRIGPENKQKTARHEQISHSNQGASEINKGRKLELMRPRRIDFGLPDGMRGFQRSFYRDYLKHKAERRSNIKAKAGHYLSIQQQIRKGCLDKEMQAHKVSDEAVRNSLSNGLMLKRSRNRRQHELEEYLVTGRMGGATPRNIE